MFSLKLYCHVFHIFFAMSNSESITATQVRDHSAADFLCAEM